MSWRNHRHRWGGNRARVRVLVADEDPLQQYLCVRALQRSGFGVVASRDATDAAEAITEAHVAVAVVSLSLPGMKGERLIACLHRLAPKVGLVALSHALTPADRQRFDVLGVRAWLRRPVLDPAPLRDAVRYAGANRRPSRTG